MTVCQTCFNRRWLPLPWEQLPPEITWATADYYRQHEPEKFCKPCPACNAGGHARLGELEFAPQHPELAQVTNPVFKKNWRWEGQ